MRWRPFLESGNARVVHIDLSPHASGEAEALGWLDNSEKGRRNRFVHPAPRRRFTLCRAVLREQICSELGCRNDELSFVAAKFGKPFACVSGAPARISFNVSHGGRHGLIILAPRGRIGVDVEERLADRDLDGYIRTLFAPGERSELEASKGRDKVELFYRLWTLKEALVKAAGDGLTLDTCDFEIPLAMIHGESAGEFSFPGTPSTRWRIENIGNERFAAAIARELI